MLLLKNLAVRPGPAIVIMLVVMVMSGCAMSVKYTYDVKASFPDLKTYQWSAPTGITHQDHLLESNVESFADQDLGGKGLTRKTDQADLLVWMTYEFEYGKPYQLATLTLHIARADNREAIWRGTATGGIRTDADLKGLEEVVKSILANYPPK